MRDRTTPWVALAFFAALFGFMLWSCWPTLRHNAALPITYDRAHISIANNGATTLTSEAKAMVDKTTTPKSAAPDLTTWKSAGRNVRFTQLDGMLFIAVAITPDTINASPVSGSGKSKSVGSTLGNIGLDNSPIKFGVNVYSPVN